MTSNITSNYVGFVLSIRIVIHQDKKRSVDIWSRETIVRLIGLSHHHTPMPIAQKNRSRWIPSHCLIPDRIRVVIISNIDDYRSKSRILSRRYKNDQISELFPRIEPCDQHNWYLKQVRRCLFISPEVWIRWTMRHCGFVVNICTLFFFKRNTCSQKTRVHLLFNLTNTITLG